MLKDILGTITGTKILNSYFGLRLDPRGDLTEYHGVLYSLGMRKPFQKKDLISRLEAIHKQEFMLFKNKFENEQNN